MLILSQSAQDAFFLACPLLEHVDHIPFSCLSELRYVYVALNELPQSEFTVHQYVLPVGEEILTTESLQTEGSCPIAPIVVSSYPALPPEQGNHMIVVVDGNHRATATMVPRLIIECPAALTTKEPGELLGEFGTDYGLGLK